MRTLCLGIVTAVLCLSLTARAGAEGSDKPDWIAERIQVTAGISLTSEFVFEHEGGLLVLDETPEAWRILFVKNGKIEPLQLPGGKLSHEKRIELWNTPNGFFATIGMEGLKVLTCRVQGREVKPLKDSDGNDFVAEGVTFSFTEGLPLLSVHRVLGLFKTIDALHVWSGTTVKPVKGADGKVVEAHKWFGVSGARKLFATSTPATDEAAEQTTYYHLEGDTCTRVEISNDVPIPEGAGDTSSYLDRYFLGSEIVIFGWNEEGTRYRFWRDCDGKAEWFMDGDAPVSHAFSLIEWRDGYTFAAGAVKGSDGAERGVVYRVKDDKAEALKWPQGAVPGQGKLEYARGQLFLSQRAEKLMRFWRLVDGAFEPITGADGKPLEIEDAAGLALGAQQFGVAVGLLSNCSVCFLDGTRAVPVRDSDGGLKVFNDGYELMGIGGQPFVQWWEWKDTERYVTCLRRVAQDGRVQPVTQHDGTPLPEGESVILEAPDGLYIETKAENKTTYWWVHRNKQ